jgi:hypothetical protein
MAEDEPTANFHNLRARVTFVIGRSLLCKLRSASQRDKRETGCIMHTDRHYLEYDPVALAVLFLGMGVVGLVAFI